MSFNYSMNTPSPSMLSFDMDIPITAFLHNSDVFQLFHPDIMEQVVVNKERVFFPTPSFNVLNLESDCLYKMSLRFDKTNNKRFQFNRQTKQWTKYDKVSNHKESEVFVHPSEIRTGDDWMKSPVEFFIKVTNLRSSESDEVICLESQCKYQPTLLIQKVFRDCFGCFQAHGPPVEIKFALLTFIATTRYCSRRIADIKSSLNPFSSQDTKKKNKRNTLKAVSQEENQPIENSSFHQSFSNQYLSKPDLDLKSTTLLQIAPDHSFEPTNFVSSSHFPCWDSIFCQQSFPTPSSSPYSDSLPHFTNEWNTPTFYNENFMSYPNFPNY